MTTSGGSRCGGSFSWRGQPRWISATNRSPGGTPTARARRRCAGPRACASSPPGRGRGRRAAQRRLRMRWRRGPPRPARDRRSAARWPRPGSARGRASTPPRDRPPRLSAASDSGPSTRKRHGLVRWWFGAQRPSSSSSSSSGRETGSWANALCVRRLRMASSSSMARNGTRRLDADLASA